MNAETKNKVGKVVTTMLAVSMGFLIYTIIAKTLNEPNIVGETLS